LIPKWNGYLAATEKARDRAVPALVRCKKYGRGAQPVNETKQAEVPLSLHCSKNG